MATIIITGGTGLIGKALATALVERKHEVIILTRSEPENKLPGLRYARWDIAAGIIDPKAMADADCIIHLAGANVAEKRWTKKEKKK